MPQTEQHEPDQRANSVPSGECCWLLPLATHSHTHYRLHPFHFMLFKFENVVAKQHPHVCTHHYTCTWTCDDVVPLLHNLHNENDVITCL